MTMRGCNHGFSADLLSLKTASYAVMHLVVATLVAYALTLDWRKAMAIGLIEPFVQTFAFALHDRYWRGRERSRPASSAVEGGGTRITSSG
jgi:uncharacterized membrane protein